MKRPDAHDRYLAAIRQAKNYKDREKKIMANKLKKFPDVSDRDKRIARVREDLGEAYDLAAAEQERSERMGRVSKVDEQRFPAVTGEQR